MVMRRNGVIFACGGCTRQIAGVLKEDVIYWNAMKHDKSGKGVLSEL
jgi:bacterioferritin-associated ferredoxin